MPTGGARLDSCSLEQGKLSPKDKQTPTDEWATKPPHPAKFAILTQQGPRCLRLLHRRLKSSIFVCVRVHFSSLRLHVWPSSKMACCTKVLVVRCQRTCLKFPCLSACRASGAWRCVLNFRCSCLLGLRHLRWQSTVHVFLFIQYLPDRIVAFAQLLAKAKVADRADVCIH